jgi:hypothetical protein
MMLLAASLAALVPIQAPKEERLKETEYDEPLSSAVKAYEAAVEMRERDAAGALKFLEEKVLASPPRFVETVIVVVFATGPTKGAEKERHAFYPWRLAGELALATGQPEKAAGYLAKSSTSADLLAKARKAVEEKKAAAPVQKPAPPAAPKVDLAPFYARHDYRGALEALRPHREAMGKEHDAKVDEVKKRALEHQAGRIELLAAALPRLEEADFQAQHVAPCLKACAGVPAELETDELRWIGKLSAWFAKRDRAEFDRLAIAALRFGGNFHVAARLAQQARLREVEKIVDDAVRAPRTDRPAVLERLAETERAFHELSQAREIKELKDALAKAKERLPIDDEALERARGPAPTAQGVRMRADELERLWANERRTRLSLQDQADLALYLAIYRASALFLDGKRIAEVAADPRVAEAFRLAGPLPEDVSPKIAAVRGRIK